MKTPFRFSVFFLASLAATAYSQTTVTTSGGTANKIPVFTGSATIGNSVITQSGSNVGIGTATPSFPLEVNGVAVFDVGGTGGKISVTSPGGTSGLVMSNTNRADIRFDNSMLYFLAGTGTSSPLATSGFVLTTAGKVGIGTTAPAYLLDVNGVAQFNPGGTGGKIAIGTPAGTSGLSFSSTNRADIRFDNQKLYFLAGAGTSSPAATNGLILTTAGYVGVRTTSPAYPLDVAGVIRSSSGGFKFPDGTVQTTAAAGGITSIIAGTGLTGGGTSGAVTLAINQAQVPMLTSANTFTNPNTFNAAVNVEGNTSLAGVNISGVVNSSAAIYAKGIYGSNYTQPYSAVEGDDYSNDGVGVEGLSFDNGASSTGYGGVFEGYYGVYAYGSHIAGDFDGNVYVGGTLSKAGGSFKIDDPIDPANKYLSHSFVESPDMMNVYNGNVTTDGGGFATVTMPDWFQALNQDFRYQLTVIGQFAQAIVSREIDNNQFVIQTDKPGVKVSWQVTGIRHDAWANAHRIPVEENKPDNEKGQYLHPELFGHPEAKAIGARPHKTLQKAEN